MTERLQDTADVAYRHLAREVQKLLNEGIGVVALIGALEAVKGAVMEVTRPERDERRLRMQMEQAEATAGE